MVEASFSALAASATAGAPAWASSCEIRCSAGALEPYGAACRSTVKTFTALLAIGSARIASLSASVASLDGDAAELRAERAVSGDVGGSPFARSDTCSSARAVLKKQISRRESSMRAASRLASRVLRCSVRRSRSALRCASQCSMYETVDWSSYPLSSTIASRVRSSL